MNLSRLLAVLWFTMVAAMTALPTLASAQGQSTEGLVIETDVQYGTAGGVALAMDVYRPQGSDPVPALVALHGGGFVGGDRKDMRGVAIYFANNGYAVFCIDYRLAPDFPYPSAVEDAQTAVRFIRDRAEDYGVDPAKIGALGGSAGGTIAVSVAAAGAGAVDSGPGVGVAVSWSGALDLPTAIEDRGNNGTLVENLLSYVGMPQADPSDEEVQQSLLEASPSHQVGEGTPPVFVANAQTELMPIHQAEVFVDRLEELGIAHEFFSPAQGHALKYAREAGPPTLAFLERSLGASQGEPTPSSSGSPPPSAPPSPGGSSLLLPGLIAVGVVVLLALAAARLRAIRRGRDQEVRW